VQIFVVLTLGSTEKRRLEEIELRRCVHYPPRCESMTVLPMTYGAQLFITVSSPTPPAENATDHESATGGVIGQLADAGKDDVDEP